MFFRKLFQIFNTEPNNTFYKYATSVQIHKDVNKIIKDLNKNHIAQQPKSISKTR